MSNDIFEKKHERMITNIALWGRVYNTKMTIAKKAKKGADICLERNGKKILFEIERSWSVNKKKAKQWYARYNSNDVVALIIVCFRAKAFRKKLEQEEPLFRNKQNVYVLEQDDVNLIPPLIVKYLI